ncbi:UNVERIFIED_CONTAM: Long-chain-alcohol oxidase FAO2 [Sesamum calycinum]|uniref:Long-chain-alcohol oxidase n=1 Tax=Sesamum calycinum TaxID=2727403 RepID=A0AAW2RW03_9LAMI
MKGEEPHPLLRGGRRNCSSYSHGFSSSQIQSLAAICQTLIPPLPFDDNDANLLHQANHSFYKSSGPDETFADFSAYLGIMHASCGNWFHEFSALGPCKLIGGRAIGEEGGPGSRVHCELSVKVSVKQTGNSFALLMRIQVTLLGKQSDTRWRPLKERRSVRRPLEKGIIEIMNEDELSLKESLVQKGIDVAEDGNENVYKIKCDVVIGSGCGGGVAAAVLAKSGQKVLILEKGHYFVPEDYSGLEGPAFSELYESGGMLTTLDGKIMVMAGTAVGGGSSINWSACIRTPDYILKEWSTENKIHLFGSHDYQSAMDAVWRGLVSLKTVCKKDFKTKRGDKKGTDSTWLVDAVKNGAVILTGCKAETLMLVSDKKEKDRKRCLGVIAAAENKNIRKKFQIEARATVSACGSLFTPPLLISSGLENKHIGKNLHLHPVSLVWGYFPESLVELKGKSFEGGILTSLHKVQSEQESDIQAIVEAAALGPASFAALFPWASRRDMNDRMTKYARTAVLFALAKDHGSGEVRKPGHIKYRLSSLDKENLKTGLRRALRILIGAGAVEVGTFRSDGQRMRCKGLIMKTWKSFLTQLQQLEGRGLDQSTGLFTALLIRWAAAELGRMRKMEQSTKTENVGKQRGCLCVMAVFSPVPLVLTQ